MFDVLPEHDLLIRLAGVPGTGTYEAHVTVAAADPAERERFRALCSDLGVKCVIIELPAGSAPTQPMTASYHRGLLADVAHEVAALAGRVRAGGFPVARLKVEAVATNEGVPDTDDAARALPASNYFEFHAKIRLPVNADFAAVRDLCARHGARLSSNALKAHADGTREQFVTLRVYGAGRKRAFADFDRLCAELTAAGHKPTSRLKEYSIYDSRESLDAGWIDRAGSNPSPPASGGEGQG